MGRLIKEITSDGSEKLYIYDAANNRKSLIIKVDGDIYTHTTYSYDKMNRLTQVSENGELVATYTYDTNGNRESINYSNGNTTEYTYNLANNLKRLTNRLGAEVLSQYTYTYLLDGNQETKTDHNGKITTYTYDDLGRLISEAPDNEPSITYTYDDYNNRRAMTIEGISETTYEYDKSNRLKVERKIAGDITEITRYSYDHNGNQIYKGTEVIKPDMGETPSVNILVAGVDGGSSIVTFNQYNGFNQLIKTIVGDKTINYSYNGKGLRSSKEVNGAATIHIWDG
ncbi:RHS repeat protein, partial [Alkaliphilus serpentinus]